LSTDAGAAISVAAASRARRRPIGRVARFGLRALLYVVLVAISVVMLFPYVWMLSGSLRSQPEIFANLYPLTIWTLVPKKWTLDNFRALLDLQPFPFTHYVLNSLFVAVTVTALSIVVNACAAYVFARIPFRGRDQLFALFIATTIIPFEVIVVPLYLEMRLFDWVDTYRALIIPFAASPFGMFLLRQFFRGIPYELEEAARIDGCSRFGAFVRIILPNSLPALIAFAIIRFQLSWDSFLWPLIAASSPEVRVIQVAIATFDSDVEVKWNLIFAAAVIASFPVVMIVAFLQRYYVQGVATTGFK
jgi:ABC-type glycerol-3-phosphate transport system permease component